MRILVFGAAGFLGSNCLRYLKARGHEPVAIVRRTSNISRLIDLAESVQILQVPGLDVNSVSAAIQPLHADTLINAAWYAEPKLYLHDIDHNLEALATGIAILEAALRTGISRIILLGSCLENIEVRPQSIYTITKRSLHSVALSTAIRARSSVVCAHVFSPYGPGEHGARAVPSVIKALLQGEPIAVGTGASRRDYIHVSDVSSALSMLAESSLAGTVDICSGSSVPIRTVFATIAHEVGRPDLLRWGEATFGLGESFDTWGDPAPLHALGWLPQFDLQRGIRDTVAWWRAQIATTRGTT